MDGSIGTPGVSALRTAAYGNPWFTVDGKLCLPGMRFIDGTKSRDPGNTGDVDNLRPGLLMGKITSSSKWAPSIIGVTTVAYADGDLTLTVGIATAVEIVRRIGTSGTVKLVGPNVPSGGVQITSVAYTAVDTSTGVITVPDLNVAAIAGSFIMPNDGSENPLTFIDEGTGVQVTDLYRQNSMDASFPTVPVAGVVRTAGIINWPSDSSLQNWLMSKLNDVGGGKFIFDVTFA